MIVVEMQDDRIERQPFVAALGAAAADVLQTVEQTLQARADGMRFLRIARQRVRAFVGRAERAGSAVVGEVFAERLLRPALRALRNRVGQHDLIFARHLMHASPPAVCAHSTPGGAAAHLSGFERASRWRNSCKRSNLGPGQPGILRPRLNGYAADGSAVYG